MEEIMIIKKFLCSVYLKTKHILISIREFNELHLMDRVIYKGQDYYINNMTNYNSDGIRLYEIRPRSWCNNNKYYVSRSEFKKKFCWFNIKNGMTFHYKQWKDYWYRINLRQMMNK